jgi:hypothetical protein
MGLKSLQRNWWENILLLVVFVGMLAFIVNSYVLEQRTVKQRALYYQLMLMRQGVNLYTTMEKAFPKNLVELGVTTYSVPGSQAQQRYVERLPLNTEGIVIDPFGNPYRYDRKTGRMMSSTPGYEFW